jgi:hypothetical protein
MSFNIFIKNNLNEWKIKPEIADMSALSSGL